MLRSERMAAIVRSVEDEGPFYGGCGDRSGRPCRHHDMMVDLMDEVRRLQSMLPEQYAAGFRDATAAAAALDAHAPFIVGPDAG